MAIMVDLCRCREASDAVFIIGFDNTCLYTAHREDITKPSYLGRNPQEAVRSAISLFSFAQKLVHIKTVNPALQDEGIVIHVVIH